MTRPLGTAEVLHGNALDLPFPDDSIDLIVTSPPYFQLRSYSDDGEHYDGQIGDEPTPAEFVDALIAVTREAMRVLRPSGSLWVNLGDKYGRGSRNTVSLGSKSGRGSSEKVVPTGYPKSLIGIPWRYAIRCMDDLGLTLQAEVLWNKPNAVPESVTDRVQRSHEHWFHFTASDDYFTHLATISERDPDTGVPVPPGSVWSINTEPLRLPDHLDITHFAAYPREWPRRIIEGWCPEGGVVLDPFGGTGTTALVAKALGRHGISLDLSNDYGRIATWRTNDPAQLAKVHGGTQARAAQARAALGRTTGTVQSLF